MLDLLHLPKPQNGYIDYYIGKSGVAGSTNISSWEIWEKPRGINMIRITTIGGGGGGGSGFPSATTNARGGGGGGGSGGYTSVLIPAIYLPDRLYVSAGRGGTGGASSTTVGNAGGLGFGSYVAIAPYTTLTAIYTVCYANASTTAPTAATAAAVGGAGAAAAVATIANTLIAGLGIFTAYAGAQGSSGGLANNGTGANLTYPTTNGLLLSGGAGGGGGIGAGGSIAAPAQASFVYFTSRNGGAATSVEGDAGIELYQPLLSTGGAGGGSSSGNTLGGDGGEGGFGSGGGGGGAGGAVGGGGAGGNGGPGLVIIHSW